MLIETSHTKTQPESRYDDVIQDWRNEIDRRLLQVVNGSHPEILYDPIHYVLQGRGKRVRPILLLLASQAVGGKVATCWDAAIAIELLHNFTLVHDDIMDEDDTRRGRPTVHRKWNSDIALLSGDGLLALAFRSLLNTDSPHLSQVARVFTDGVVELCEGQALDLNFETRAGVAPQDYFEMIGKKTAKLLDISARIGAILGGGSAEQAAAVGQFAYNLGCAFQIQDDLLDITSDEVTLGKTFASDVKRKKQTFLVIHALSHGDAGLQERLRRLLAKQNIDSTNIDEIKEIFQSSGSIAAAERAAERYLTAAQNSLDQLNTTHGKELLHAFLDYISKRNA